MMSCFKINLEHRVNRTLIEELSHVIADSLKRDSNNYAIYFTILAFES